MKKLCSLIVLFLICSSLLIPIQASANSGGEIDCSVTPDECEQMIAAQALVIQELGGEPVPWPGQAPALSSEEVVATGDWAFVEEYKVRMMNAAAFMCTNDEVRGYLATHDLSIYGDAVNSKTAWDNWMPGLTDEFFALQEQMEVRLRAEISANDGVVPDGKPDHAYTVVEVLLMLDDHDPTNCGWL